MLRGLGLAFYAAVVSLMGLLGVGAVNLSMEVQTEVSAGEEFDVYVDVEKEDIESFARFQSALPRGLEAVSGEAENANFQFENGSVRFIWMRLPVQDKFRIHYRVKVDPRLRGAFDLGGEFSYIHDNTRKSVAVDAKNITIAPSGSVPPDRQLDLAEYQKSIPAQRDVQLQASRVRCIREKPSLLGEGKDLVVRILVNRGEASKFAKVEEVVPKGYTAEPIESRDAIFSFEDGVVKFLWMALPPQPMFTVSYRLIPQSKRLRGMPKIRGSFSFVHDEATRSIRVVQRDVQLQNLSPSELEALVRGAQGHGRGATGSGYTSGSPLEVQAPDEGGEEYTVQYKPIGRAARAGRHRRGGMRGSSYMQRLRSVDEHMLAPEEGVYYRVQVAAGHRPVDVDRYFRRRSLHADVRAEKHDGWYKYSVGSFPVYKEARDYRDKVWNTTPIRDAFVAAYNNGARITVQEALMITSQKWYR